VEIVWTEDFFLGLISGALLTLMGFGLTVLWESHRHAKEERNIRKNLIAMLRLETEENLKLARYNSERIRMNLDFIRQEKYSILPLLEFHQYAWLTARASVSILKISTTDLMVIWQLYQTMYIFNQEVKARESFRRSSVAMEGFYESLSKRDTWLEKGLRGLEDKLNETKAILERLNK